MLVIESLNPTGMFSFSECRTLDLSGKGLINLKGVNEDKFGDSNGAGKSSLFNALCETLYQENPTKVSGDAVINTCWGRGFASRLTFVSWQQLSYRVTYCRKWGKPIYPSDNDNHSAYTGTALFFEKLVGGVWVDVRGASMRETQDKIRDAVGLTYEQFLAVAYMSPRTGNVLLRGANKDRMDVLSGIVRLQDWDSILDGVREQKRAFQSKVTASEKVQAFLEGELSQLESQLAQMRNVDFAGEISRVETLLQLEQVKQANLTNQIKLLSDEMQQINKNRDELWKSLNPEGLQANILEIKQRIQAQHFAKNQQFIQVSSELSKSLRDVEASLNASKGKLNAVKSNTLSKVEKCPTCGAKITKASRDKLEYAIREAEEQVASFQVAWNAANAEIERNKAEQEKEIQKKHAKADKEIVKLNTELEKAQKVYSEAVARYNEVGARPLQVQEQVSKLNAQAAEVFNSINQLQFQLDRLNKQRLDFDVLNDQVLAKQCEVDEAKAGCEDLVDEMKHRDWLISNIPYIKLHKLSVALGELSNMANQYLRGMGDTAQLFISSFKEKKKASSEAKVDMLKGEISVTIIDGGKNIDPRLYSDGETARISNALTRALHDLAMQYGHGCNLVLLDEIFSYVDANNSQRIASSFSDIPAEMTYIVTDNSGMVNDLMSFNETWTARKSNGLTTIEV